MDAPDTGRTGARDADIGLVGHVTTTPPLGGRLKVRVDDFIVEELGPGPVADSSGRYVAARVRLTNWETNAFIAEASDRLGISRKKVHLSGTKDKRGVTEQWFTFEADAGRVADLSQVSGVEILTTVQTAREVELGDHSANHFRLIVRGIQADVGATSSLVGRTWDEITAAGGVPNVFGPQRFGARRATTHRVGERMVRGDFLGAVLAYLGASDPASDEGARETKAALEARDWKRALAALPERAHFERTLLHRLVETEGDPVAALLAFPKNLQRLFVSAYQSWIFNRIVSARIAQGLPLARPVEGDLVAPIEGGQVGQEFVPVTVRNLERVRSEVAKGRAAITGLLPGIEAPIATGPMGGIEARVMAEENLATRDFLIPEHLEWSSKGTRRALAVTPRGFLWEAAPDELSPGRTRVEFRFQLPPGSYATSVLREFVKSPWLDDYA